MLLILPPPPRCGYYGELWATLLNRDFDEWLLEHTSGKVADEVPLCPIPEMEGKRPLAIKETPSSISNVVDFIPHTYVMIKEVFLKFPSYPGPSPLHPFYSPLSVSSPLSLSSPPLISSPFPSTSLLLSLIRLLSLIPLLSSPSPPLSPLHPFYSPISVSSPLSLSSPYPPPPSPPKCCYVVQSTGRGYPQRFGCCGRLEYKGQPII